MAGTFIPVGEFAPDVAGQPALYDGGTVAANTLPLESGNDGPIRAPYIWTNAIAGTLNGAFSANWPDLAAPAWFAATDANLYWGDSAGLWADVTGAGYLSTFSPRSFCQFGKAVIVTDGGNAPRAFDLESPATFAALSGAPTARYCAAVEPGFVMLGYYDDGLTIYPSGVRWSGINDHTSWPTIGTAAATSAQSDAQTLPANSAITGIVPSLGGAAAAIFTERSIFRADYQGPPTVFAFRMVDGQIGCVAPRSLVTIGGVAYFLSENGFCAFDGAQVRMIGKGRVDRYFFNQAAPSLPLSNIDWTQIWGAVDPNRKVIIWAFPSFGNTTPNRWLIYSYATERWRYADSSNISTALVFQAGFGQYTTVAGFRSGKLVSWDNAANLPISCTLATGYADAGPASGRRVFVTGARMLTDASTYTAQIGYRATLSATEQFSAATSPTASGICPQRVSTRYAKMRGTLNGTVDWSYVKGFEVYSRPEGRR